MDVDPSPLSEEALSNYSGEGTLSPSPVWTWAQGMFRITYRELGTHEIPAGFGSLAIPPGQTVWTLHGRNVPFPGPPDCDCDTPTMTDLYPTVETVEAFVRLRPFYDESAPEIARSDIVGIPFEPGPRIVSASQRTIPLTAEPTLHPVSMTLDKGNVTLESMYLLRLVRSTDAEDFRPRLPFRYSCDQLLGAGLNGGFTICDPDVVGPTEIRFQVLTYGLENAEQFTGSWTALVQWTEANPYGSGGTLARTAAGHDLFEIVSGTAPPPPPSPQDSISLSNPVPPNLSNLASESTVTFSSDVAYSLETADNGFVELRVETPDSQILTAARCAVIKGDAQVNLSSGPVQLPAGINGVMLRAVLLDPADSVLVTATGATYTVQSLENSISLSNPNPPDGTVLSPGSTVDFGSVVNYSVHTGDGGLIAFQVLDQSGAFLAEDSTDVPEGSGQLTLSVGDLLIPHGITGITLRAHLMDWDLKNLAQATGASYTVQSEGDSISLSNPDPPDGTVLSPWSTVDFESVVNYSLQTVDDGTIYFQAVDQSGALQSHSYHDVSKGSGQPTLSIGEIIIPPEIGGITLRAELQDEDGNVLAQATGASYVVEGEVDVTIDRVEVVQVTQDENNSIPLIYNKGTAAHVFTKLLSAPTDQIAGVEVILRGFAGGVELSDSPRRPASANTQRKITAKQPQGENLNHIHIFPLPWPWVRNSQLTLRAEADPQSRIEDVDRSNNQLEQTFRFQKTRKFVIRYLPVCVQLPGQAKKCPGTKISNADHWLLKMYPISGANLHYLALEVPEAVWTTDLNDEGQQTLFMVHLRRRFQLMVAQAGGLIKFDQLAAWLPSGSTHDFGVSDPRWLSGDGRVSLNQDTTAAISEKDASATLAHEVGHNLGLRHPNTADGCEAKDSGTDWPHATATIQHYGWDAADGILRRASNWDVMAYCWGQNGRVWISPFHYRKLAQSDFLPQPQAVAGEAAKTMSSLSPEPVARAASQDLALISGLVKADGTAAELSPLYRIDSAAQTSPSDPAGSHCVRFEGGGGRLGEHCFGIDFVDPETDEPLAEQGFSLLAPLPAGTRRIDLVRNNQQIASLAASANPPVVSILSPQPGEQWSGGESRTLTWSGADPDDDSLIYSVMYSHDGGATWVSLSTDTADTQYTFDTAAIRGGTNVWFRVLATDGFHTAAASVGAINLNQQPAIEIASDPFDLLNAVVGDFRQDALTIRNNGSGPLTVSSIDGQGETFQVTSPQTPVTIQAGSQRSLRVRFAPPSEGLHTAVLTLASDDPNRPAATVQLQGTGVLTLAPEIRVTPPSVDFGNINIGETGVASVVVLNRGPSDWTVDSLIVNNPAFRADPMAEPVTLATGATFAVDVRFLPVATGQQTATLTLISQDPNLPTVTAALAGTGAGSGGGGGGDLRPAIKAGGIVGAASFQRAVAPGGLASIFGDVGNNVAFATATPLPRELSGVRVQVNGIPAPLVYVSPGQINFQIPYEASPGMASVVVIRNKMRSVAQTVEVKQYSPGFFTFQGNTAIAQRPDLSLVTSDSPAKAGEGLVFYITGIGGLSNPPATGAPAGGSPLSTSLVQPTLTVGGTPANIFFAGLTPFFIGLGQINAYMPDPLPAVTASHEARRAGSGMAPVVLDFGGSRSQVAELPVESSGPTDGEIGVTINSVTPSSLSAGEMFMVDFTITSAEPLSQQVQWLVYLSADDVIDPLEDEMLTTGRVDYTGHSMNVRRPSIPVPAGKAPGRYYAGVVIVGGAGDNSGNNASVGLPLDVTGGG
jgi:uncharacterized protein (TIGR03437 family)